MRFNGLIPVLQTEDMKRTRDWYESVLGFQCVSAEGDGWCRLVRDDVAIMFMHNDLGSAAHDRDPIHLRR